MYALIDGNNIYVSCERVFAPHLVGKPVVVLSSNDGACIARSNEAKDMGVKMAQPWFQVRHLEKAGLIAVSANHELYGDMRARMMDSEPHSRLYLRWRSGFERSSRGAVNSMERRRRLYLRHQVIRLDGTTACLLPLAEACAVRRESTALCW